jgi:hypothetical protein
MYRMQSQTQLRIVQVQLGAGLLIIRGLVVLLLSLENTET